jgi:hypothetical protein
MGASLPPAIKLWRVVLKNKRATRSTQRQSSDTDPKETDMNIIEKIREIAYTIWEGQGRPEGQHEQNWLEAERRYNSGQPSDAIEGEGNYTAAAAYDRAATDFAQSGRVAPAAEEAERSLSDPAQSEEMARAEAAGKSHSHGEDPALKK